MTSSGGSTLVCVARFGKQHVFLHQYGSSSTRTMTIGAFEPLSRTMAVIITMCLSQNRQEGKNDMHMALGKGGEITISALGTSSVTTQSAALQ